MKQTLRHNNYRPSTAQSLTADVKGLGFIWDEAHKRFDWME